MLAARRARSLAFIGGTVELSIVIAALFLSIAVIIGSTLN